MDGQEIRTQEEALGLLRAAALNQGRAELLLHDPRQPVVVQATAHSGGGAQPVAAVTPLQRSSLARQRLVVSAEAVVESEVA